MSDSSDIERFAGILADYDTDSASHRWQDAKACKKYWMAGRQEADPISQATTAHDKSIREREMPCWHRKRSRQQFPMFNDFIST